MSGTTAVKKTAGIGDGGMKMCDDLWTDAAQQFVAGERGIALFSTGSVRRGLRATARAT